jgi:AcrR family transcriptional regulator
VTSGGRLPIAGQVPVAERADAVRNRRKILAAAEAVAARDGFAGLTVDAVARTAGVGVGTVYRRFTDRAGLLNAMLHDRELELQEAFLTGPPPLGPGAPAPERIRAFLHALVDRVDVKRELLLSLEAGLARSRDARAAPVSVHHAHLAMLLREARPDADAHYLATALLAAVSPTTIDRHQREHEATLADVKAGIDDLLTGVVPRSDGKDRPPGFGTV